MIAVLTALGARWDSPLVTLLEGSATVRIARRCADLAELLAAAESGVGEAVLLSADVRGLGLSDVERLRATGLVVAGVSDPEDEATERRLRQLGIRRVVPASAAVAEVEAALRTDRSDTSDAADPDPATGAGPGALTPGSTTVTAGTAAQTPGTPAHVVAVWGPIGSPGRTTVAVNVAMEAAAAGVPTLLVDLDTYGASVAQSLALLDEAPGVVAAARAAEHGQLDVAALASLAPLVRPGLRVLTGLPRPHRWPELRAPAVERVLHVARHLVEVVVVDCGFNLEEDEELSYDTQAPRRNQTTRVALAEADTAVVVGSCDPIGLQRLVRALQDLTLVAAPSPVVVVNRLRPGAVGPRPRVRVAEALARFAGTQDVLFVPDDPAGADAALLAGAALGESSPASPARVALAQLAGRAIGRTLPAPVRRRRWAQTR